MKTIINIVLALGAMAYLSSCSVGSFVSGGAYRSWYADECSIANGLSPNAEEHIVNRAKAEMLLDRDTNKL